MRPLIDESRFDSEFRAVAEDINATTIEYLYSTARSLREPARSALTDVIHDYRALHLASTVGQKVGLALAWDLGFRNVDKLVRVNSAAAFGSLYSLLLDDIVDNAGSQAPLSYSYLAHLLFIFYLRELREISPDTWNDDGFEVFVQAEIETYCAIFDEELNHVGHSQSFTSRDLVTFKCSPIKALINASLHVTGRPELKPLMFRVLEDASFALCLLDDLVDWEEDLDRERYTYPIQAAIDELGISIDRLSTHELKTKVLRQLAFTSLFDRLMNESAELLLNCRRSVKPFSPKLAYWFEKCHEDVIHCWTGHIRYRWNIR